jgi:4-amino-4-deoxy-L-arabinose transferase-like glycosyltransferase
LLGAYIESMTNSADLQAAQASAPRNPDWGRGDYGILVGLCLLGLALILFVGRDYGISWDEPNLSGVGRSTLNAYRTLERPTESYAVQHGPFYFAVAELLAGVLSGAQLGFSASDGHHLANALCFLLTAVSVYSIARGFVGRLAAVLGTLMLVTQPLLFGHAFINPKDIPFMGFFAAAMAVGMVLYRSTPAAPFNSKDFYQAEQRRLERARSAARNRWLAASRLTKLVAILGAAVAAVVLVDLVFVHRLVLPGITPLVVRLYEGRGAAPFQALFDRLAENRGDVPVEAYIAKAVAALNRLTIGGIALLLLAALTMAAAQLAPPLRRLGRGYLALLVLAGVMLGLTTAIRILGPLAGLLVSGLLVSRLRLWALPALLVYWLTASVVCYLAWPYLWGHPIAGLLDSLKVMSQFPWNDPVLFGGRFILAKDLPWFYAPVLFGLQLTLPALVLGLLGGILGAAESHRRHSTGAILVLWSWLILPPLLVIGMHSTVYDNARHLLFALPPLFIMGGLAFEWMFRRIHPPAVRGLIGLVACLPGLLAIAQLHPYEYIYYNEIVGGVGGAARRYELDYWGTGFRQAMEELNRIAPEGASVAVSGPLTSAWPFAREDLVLWKNPRAAGTERPDFQIATSRWNWDLDPTQWHRLAHADWWPEARVVWALERDGAPLVVIKELKHGE